MTATMVATAMCDQLQDTPIESRIIWRRSSQDQPYLLYQALL